MIGHEHYKLFDLLSLEPLYLSKFFSGPLNLERLRVTCIYEKKPHEKN